MEASSTTLIAIYALAALIVPLAAAGQIALFFANRSRLRLLLDQGVAPARAVLQVLKEPSSTLAAAMALQTLGIGVAAGATLALAIQAWSRSPLLAVLVVAAGLGLINLLQSLARALTLARPETVALIVYRPIRLLAVVLLPLTAPILAIERALLRRLGANGNGGPSADAEIRELVEANGALDEGEREMIQSIVTLGDRPVREVMVPRIDVVALPRTASVAEVLDRIVATGFSRIPLYDQSIDNVVGVVYAKDVLRHLRSGKTTDPAEPLARKPYFVPDTKKVDELLREMQRQRVHLAVVVDEYGGTAGIITIEDLLEEIVGEIRDEYDLQEEEVFERVSDTEAIVDARITIRDVNELLGLHLDPEEFDTLGGLVYSRLGKVPVPGDETRVNGCVISVLSTVGRRIKKVRVVITSRDHAPT